MTQVTAWTTTWLTDFAAGVTWRIATLDSTTLANADFVESLGNIVVGIIPVDRSSQGGREESGGRSHAIVNNSSEVTDSSKDV